MMTMMMTMVSTLLRWEVLQAFYELTHKLGSNRMGICLNNLFAVFDLSKHLLNKDGEDVYKRKGRHLNCNARGNANCAEGQKGMARRDTVHRGFSGGCLVCIFLL